MDADGNWTFAADNAALQSLGAGEMAVDSFVVTSQDGTAQQRVNVTLHGVNDDATLAGNAAGDVLEDGADATAAGSLAVADADQGQAHTQAGHGATDHGTYGVDADGNWTYAADNRALQSLGEGETAVDSFVVTSLDGTAQQVVNVTLHGVNDDATLRGDTAGDVFEDGVLTAQGTLTATDADQDQSSVTANAGATAHGTFAVDAHGNWTYQADNATIQGLATGESLVDSFVVTSLDGSAQQTVNVTIHGVDDANFVTGTPGNDVLVATAGADIINGLGGTDTVDYSADTSSRIVINLATGTVTGSGGDTLISIENATGGLGGDGVYGDTGNNVLHGGDGNDDIDGGSGNDMVYGDAGNDFVVGGWGDDFIDGGTGADTMLGSLGNDIFVVDDPADVITQEDAGSGIDTVQSSIAYTLFGSFLENLTLTGTANINAIGNSLNNTLIGNSGNNLLDGGTGSDFFDGGTGADRMQGGTGNDTFVVDNPADVIALEGAANGIDTVQSSITYTLPAFSPVISLENLTLVGSADISGTGNALNNVIVGNAGNNVLNGATGADSMSGGAGNDTYVVDNAGDVVTENASQGTDLINSAVSYTLPADVENLNLTGLNLTGTGNALDNVMSAVPGSAGFQVLWGLDGNDTMIGGSLIRTIGGNGADTFVFKAAGSSGILTDFSSAQGDRIDLTGIDADLGATGDQAFTFIDSAAFSGQAGELRYAGGVIAGDVNGDGVADFSVMIQNFAVLAASDFFL